jgi:hypothetical protein
MENKIFKDLLAIARQIGAEKVANSEQKVSIKGYFDYGIYGELKEEIEARGVIVSDITENEKSAIIFAFCQGWNAEVVSTRF